MLIYIDCQCIGVIGRFFLESEGVIEGQITPLKGVHDLGILGIFKDFLDIMGFFGIFS